MAYTQADVDSLKRRAANGVKSGTIDGQTVVFGSMQEMREQISAMERELAAASETDRTRPDVGYVQTSRGL